MIMAGGDRSDDVIQNALLAPTRGQLLMLRRGSVRSFQIGGTVGEQLNRAFRVFSSSGAASSAALICFNQALR